MNYLKQKSMTSKVDFLLASGVDPLRPAATACLITGLSVAFLDLIWSAYGTGYDFAIDGLIPYWIFPLSLLVVCVVCLTAYAVLWQVLVRPLTIRYRRPLVPSAVALSLFLVALVLLRPIIDGMPVGTGFLVISAVSGNAFILGLLITSALNTRAQQFALSISYALPLVLIELLGFLLVTASMGIQRNAPLFWVGGLLLAISGLATAKACFRQENRRIIQRVLQALLFVLLISPLFTLAIESIDFKDRIQSDRPSGPNIILLMVDTLRRDAVSAYGGENDTPHIDQLARDGVLFENAYSNAPWTLASMSTIFTGFSPWVHQATNPESRLSDQLPTLAEHLGDLGYVTQSIGYNPFLIDPPGPYEGLQRGFDNSMFYPALGMPDTLGKALLEKFLPELSEYYPRTNEITDKVLDWISNHRQEKFFLWVHYFDPHMPYEPPERWLTGLTPEPSIGPTIDYKELFRGKRLFMYSQKEVAWIRSLYDAEVRYVDSEIGKLIDQLKRDGKYDDTLIVFASDHGEEFWEHFGFDHGHTLYNELLSVPLIFKPAGNLEMVRIAQHVNTGSITATILDMIEGPSSMVPLSYNSLAPLWESGAQSTDPVFSAGPDTSEDRQSVVFGDKKYIRHLFTHREKLFNLATDPQEQNNLILLEEDDVLEGRKLLQQYSNSQKELSAILGLDKPGEQDFDMEMEERLKALGYLK